MQTGHLVDGQSSRFVHAEHEGGPVRIALRFKSARPFVEFGKEIDSPRRADEQRAPLPVGQSGLNDFLPDFALHLGHLVQNHGVEIESAQGVGIVRTEKTQLRPVGQKNGQLALVDLAPRNGSGIMLEIIPGHGLRLIAEGRDIGKGTALPPAARSLLEQMIDGKHGLAETPMRHKHDKTTLLKRPVDIRITRPVRNDDVRHVRHINKISLPAEKPAPCPENACKNARRPDGSPRTRPRAPAFPSRRAPRRPDGSPRTRPALRRSAETRFMPAREKTALPETPRFCGTYFCHVRATSPESSVSTFSRNMPICLPSNSRAFTLSCRLMRSVLPLPSTTSATRAA